LEKPVIFLAHASEDKKRVRELYWKLKNIGLHPWLDEENISSEKDRHAEVLNAVSKCGIFILCLSTHSIDDEDYLNEESRLALDAYVERPFRSIYLILLKFDNCDVPDIRLPIHNVNLCDFQWVDYWRSGGLARLLKVIGNKKDGGNGPFDNPESAAQSVTGQKKTFAKATTAVFFRSRLGRVSIIAVVIMVTLIAALLIIPRFVSSPIPLFQPAGLSSGDRAGPKALLAIKSNVPDARVYIDGRYLGSTMLPGTVIPSGKHQVRVEKQGYRAYSREIEFIPGGREFLVVFLY
jgi:hypothetical protein